MSSRRATAPSACVVMRPGPDGQLVAVGEQRRQAPAATVRPGAVFGVWDDQTQSWQHGPDTLDGTTAAWCHAPEGEVCFWRGEYYPAPLNAAERALFRRWAADGSE